MPLDQQTFVVADPFSLDALIAWLQTKPPEEAYCYLDDGNCLISQYLIENGLAVAPSVSTTFWREGGTVHDIPQDWNDIAIHRHRILGIKVWTFGAALARARAFRDAL